MWKKLFLISSIYMDYLLNFKKPLRLREVEFKTLKAVKYFDDIFKHLLLPCLNFCHIPNASSILVSFYKKNINTTMDEYWRIKWDSLELLLWMHNVSFSRFPCNSFFFSLTELSATELNMKIMTYKIFYFSLCLVPQLQFLLLLQSAFTKVLTLMCTISQENLS